MQPLIDQGRTICLWPDKDGREAWHQVCDMLGYDRCHVYTRFFETCWREVDGQKADVADIVIRMMSAQEEPAEQPKPLDAILSSHPVVGTLIEKLNLNPVDNG